MDSNYKNYNYISSFSRLDDILALSQSNYEEVDERPDRDRLTYSNGFYVKEGYAKPSLKKYRPIAARNEDKKVFSDLL